MKEPTAEGAPQEHDSAVGAIVDRRYLLTREIARGGMGAVFEAEQQITGRRVAIKLALGAGRRLEQARERLLREARAIGVVRHPGVVGLLDAGVCPQMGPYLVLEVLRGAALDTVLAARRRLDVTDVVHIGRQLCEALAFAHEHGVVHRDLKPSNIFLARDDRPGETVKIFDFGIAEISAAAPSLRKLTREADLLGTPEYMAPEQLAGEPADHRCDVYAIGVTLYECLTGEVPFSGGYRQLIVKQMRSEGPPSIRAARPEVSANLEAVIAHALAVEVANRTPDAATFRDELVGFTGIASGRTELLAAVADEATGADSSAHPAPAAGSAEVRRPITAPIPLVRRKHERVPYTASARLELPDGKLAEGEIEDISAGGVLLASSGPLEDGQLAILCFVPPTMTTEIAVPVVTRVQPDLPAGSAGLEFRILPDDVRRAIADYVTQHSRPPGR